MNRQNINRIASAEWSGSLQEGKGKLTTESGALSDASYSFAKRFGEEVGTNPEELIAAAHAGCFTMALSNELGKQGLKADLLHTSATVSLENQNGHWEISTIDLNTYGRVPGATVEQFTAAAQTAKDNCPVSKLLRAKISLRVKFLGEERSKQTGAA